MRIAVVGAGAIGGWMGARLAASGQEVGILARGPTLEAIRRDGLSLTQGGETRVERPQASDDPAALGPQDLVIVAVKGPALASAAEAVAKLIGPDTAVVSAMNGVPWWFFEGLPGHDGQNLTSVDPAGLISSRIPPASVLGCVVHAAVGTAGPGRIVHRNGNHLILGEPSGATSARLQAASAAFADAGFEVTQSPRIQSDIWYKLWGNMTMNPISALTRATGDLILDDPLVSAFILQIMAEASDLGGRIGCPITESGEERNKVTRQLGAFRTSMLQDVEAGRPIEVDALLAAPREIAARAGLATPAMDALHGLTRLFARTQGLVL